MIDVRELLASGVHFGHRTSRWSPKMAPFIWGAKNKIHLIDVSKTAFLLDRAQSFLSELVRDGKSILWVGTKKSARDKVQEAATSLNMPFVIHRWIGGTLSNFGQIKKAMTRLLHLRDAITKAGSYHTKKELSTMQKEIARLEKNVGGILSLTYPPAAIVVVDAKREQSAVHEALRMNIPVVALVDTNTDPSGINFVIPSNDDSPRAIGCIIDYLVAPLQDARAAFEADEKARKAAEVGASKKGAALKVEATQAAPEAAAATVTPETTEVAVESLALEEDESEKKVKTSEKKPVKKLASAKKGAEKDGFEKVKEPSTKKKQA